jgi:hypothetical protein
MITTIIEYISYKMTIGLKKITKHTTMQWLFQAQTIEPPQAMTGGEAFLASFFLLEQDV